ncbi:DUF969 domain-containing protein [Metaclostridioides mangenotii]|jgi:uncharacterized membrane protein|uniref:Membrane protein n=1 Tax=Metaclostridioides mangenotii TaxID=1540 RepID=A0ABS4E9F7_9FIRM|nr:DUF969 domain-containing protein [Clostridioides mangenotii]MBP1854579.1 putative membrane protein [Clostridioides mangenotii]
MIKLIGILIIVVGFALKFNSIAIVMAAGIVTGLVGGMSITDILTTLGETYVANRYMAIFIITLPVVGVLEKNGLKQVAGDLVKKMSKATPGILAIGYTIIRGFLAAFNVSFGGVAGFIRPVISPMSEASVEKYGKKLDPKDLDEIKGMNSAAENVSWFFGQVLFIAGSGILLVKSTLDPVGYTIDPVAAVRAEVPVFIIAVIVSAFFFMMTDRKIMKKYKK